MNNINKKDSGKHIIGIIAAVILLALSAVGLTRPAIGSWGIPIIGIVKVIPKIIKAVPLISTNEIARSQVIWGLHALACQALNLCGVVLLLYFIIDNLRNLTKSDGARNGSKKNPSQTGESLIGNEQSQPEREIMQSGAENPQSSFAPVYHTAMASAAASQASASTGPMQRTSADTAPKKPIPAAVRKKPAPAAASVPHEPASAPSAENNDDSIMSTIEKLAHLMENGIITREEFDRKKAELLKKM